MADVPRFERKTAFFVTHNAAQNVPGGGTLSVAFNTIITDLGSNFAANRYTVPLDGIYHFEIKFLCVFSNANTSRHLLSLETSAPVEQVRGSDMSYTAHAGGFVVTQWLSTIKYFAAGTILQVRSSSIAGSTYNIVANQTEMYWCGFRIQSESRTILN